MSTPDFCDGQLDLLGNEHRAPAPAPRREPPADAPGANSAEPAAFPPPDTSIGIPVSFAVATPFCDGRLVWASVDRASGYCGAHGWYRLDGAWVDVAGDSAAVRLALMDAHGRTWRSTHLPRGWISAECTPEEHAAGFIACPADAPDFRAWPGAHPADPRHPDNRKHEPCQTS